METLIVRNDGPLITETNYFETRPAAQGLVYVTTNERAFRLLVPPHAAGAPIEAAGAQYVIVTRGKWPEQGWRECLEFVWEDRSDSPYHLIVETQQADRVPAPEDEGRTDLRCIGYGPGLQVLFDLPARYRRVSQVPYLKRWESTSDQKP